MSNTRHDIELNNLIYDRFNAEMVRNNVTPADVSRATDIDEVLLSRLSPGNPNRRYLTVENIVSLSKFFGCTADYLLGLSDHPIEYQKSLENFADLLQMLYRINESIPLHILEHSFCGVDGKTVNHKVIAFLLDEAAKDDRKESIIIEWLRHITDNALGDWQTANNPFSDKKTLFQKYAGLPLPGNTENQQ